MTYFRVSYLFLANRSFLGESGAGYQATKKCCLLLERSHLLHLIRTTCKSQFGNTMH